MDYKVLSRKEPLDIVNVTLSPCADDQLCLYLSYFHLIQKSVNVIKHNIYFQSFYLSQTCYYWSDVSESNLI